MNEVFVVTFEDVHSSDDFELLGVYSTEEKADKAIDAFLEETEVDKDSILFNTFRQNVE